MAIDDVSTQLRNKLQEAFGVDGATYLMDRPPGGWSDLVTNESLRLEFRAFAAEFRSEQAALRSAFVAELMTLRTEFGRELAALRSEVGTEINSVRAELGSLRSDHGNQIAELRSDAAVTRHELTAAMEREFRGQTWRLLTAVLASSTLIAAIVTLAKL